VNLAGCLIGAIKFLAQALLPSLCVRRHSPVTPRKPDWDGSLSGA
jgi:hypothetical protein